MQTGIPLVENNKNRRIRYLETLSYDVYRFTQFLNSDERKLY